ncbi:MAG TPA: thiamine-phosphate kinase [Methanocorpusculum sp.]|nr:thiamine-phosphate kinase [Methanocorpusculum sp.]
MDDRELLKSIKPLIGDMETSDDCAAYDLGNGMLMVSSTDMLHETTDFPKGMSEFQMGWMSAAVSLSDVASSGAQPVSVLVAVGLDKPERLVPFMEGVCACAERFGVKVSGGDIDSHTEFTVVTTAFGFVSKENYCPRTGARAGDIICVTGVLGRAQAALDGDERFLPYLFTPEPQVLTGVAMARAGASAMMDVSDGLSLSLWDLGEASGVRLEINSAAVPRFEMNEYALSCALFGGGDFGLLFTLPPEVVKSGLPDAEYTVIGRVTEGSGVYADGVLLERRGFVHMW